MAAVLTHDLRTPLSAILLCADKLALELPAGNDGAQQTLKHLEASTLRMARMVEQLLDFSRIRSGGLRLQASACDLAEVTRAVVAEAGSAHGHARVHLDMLGDTRLQGDLDRLGQVAANLIGNALTHGSEARVEVDGRDPRSVLLQVSNAGRIDDALLPRLFEPFKASFHPSNGLGLGLYIVDQFVRAHGTSQRAMKPVRWCSKPGCRGAQRGCRRPLPEFFREHLRAPRRTRPQLLPWVHLVKEAPCHCVPSPTSARRCRIFPLNGCGRWSMMQPVSTRWRA